MDWFAIDNYPLNEGKNVWELENKLGRVDINDADYVVTKDGKVIDMWKAKGILGDAMQQLIDEIDPMLSHYFSSMRINYTFKIDTFAADSKILYVNPAFLINAYEMDEPYGDVPMIAYILLHECFHVLYDHCTDKKGIELSMKSERDKRLVNEAMDYQINWVIENSTFNIDHNTGLIDFAFKGYTKMLDGCIDDRFKNMDWPEIYEVLKREDDEANDEGKGVEVKENSKPPQKMSQEWYDGFMDGINKKLQELRDNRLIESACKIYT